MQAAQRFHHRLHPVLVGRDGEHAKGLPAEMLLVLFRGMRGEIGAHFPLDARLQKIGAGDGHRAAVDLDHKGMAGAVRELESEDEVGDEPDLVHDSLVRELHAQRQRIACGASLLGEGGDDVVGMDDSAPPRESDRIEFSGPISLSHAFRRHYAKITARPPFVWPHVGKLMLDGRSSRDPIRLVLAALVERPANGRYESPMIASSTRNGTALIERCNMRIFLAGVSCVGKTTMGAQLAGLLEYRFFDLDVETERFFGMSIERLRNRHLTSHDFRLAAAQVLKKVLSREDSYNCVIALPPSGLLGALWKVVSETRDATTIVLWDTPENIVRRITFYDIESRPVQRNLTDHEKGLYLREIKRDIAYFNRSFRRADVSVDISGCSLDDASRKVRDALGRIEASPSKAQSEESEQRSARMHARVWL